MALPVLTRRGFWVRVVVLSANLLCYLSVALVMAWKHSLAAVVLIGVLSLFPLAGLVATFWRRPPRRTN
jgi:hypothetical protein